MTKAFAFGPSHPLWVLLLLLFGGGYAGYQAHESNTANTSLNVMTTEMASRLAADRNRYEDLQRECTEREFNILERRDGR